MRYLVLTYVKKANGQIDEQMEVTRRLRTKDLQCANVIVDFKDLKVIKCSLDGVQVPKDFNKIVQYYYQHYENVINRLFRENGYEVHVKDNDPKPTDPVS